MKSPSSKIPLLVALGIPVVMILLVAGSIYLPSLFAAQPQHNFLYTYDDIYRQVVYCEGKDYIVGPTYVIENHKVAQKTYNIPETCKPNIPTKGGQPTLLLYDVKTNESQEITIDQAKGFPINIGPVSGDGFTVQHGGGNEGIFPALFGGMSDYNTLYLIKGGYSKKLNLISRQDYYPYAFQFLGWVE